MSSLQAGDTFLVRPGARVAADRVVLSGHSRANESMITGESRVVEKGPGDRGIAGTVIVAVNAQLLRRTRI